MSLYGDGARQSKDIVSMWISRRHIMCPYMLKCPPIHIFSVKGRGPTGFKLAAQHLDVPFLGVAEHGLIALSIHIVTKTVGRRRVHPVSLQLPDQLWEPGWKLNENSVHGNPV